jgi:hypothetical protein
VNHRETAKKLIETATHPNTDENERVAAMVKAVKLIKQYDLLASPFDALVGSNETVQAATSVFQHLSSPEFVASMKRVASALGSARKAVSGRGGSSRRRR